MTVRRGVHPSKDILGTKGAELEGKKIVLCITGSIAAYRIRLLHQSLALHSAAKSR
jgi:phosphopantothenoylcysteine decarboxylase/phosphopantothenate--cysteine ligase